jgi:hypothetical protein
MLGQRLDDGLGKALRMVFLHSFGQTQTETQTQSTGVPIKSTMEAPTLPSYLYSPSAATPSPMSTFAITSSSTSTPPASAAPAASTSSSSNIPVYASAPKLMHEPSSSLA